MRYIQLAILTIVLVVSGFRPVAAEDGNWNGERYPWWNSGQPDEHKAHDPLLFAQNAPNPPDETEIRDQFLDSYYHNVPIPWETDPWSRVRLMLMWRLVDYLKIDEDTAKGFFPLYSEYMRERGELMGEQRTLATSITMSVEDESADLPELMKDTERLTKIEGDLAKLRRDLLDDSEDRLTSQQYIKLVVFDEYMKNDLLQRILPNGRNRGGFPQGDGQDNHIPNTPNNNRGFGR